jgi:hypothetical protein
LLQANPTNPNTEAIARKYRAMALGLVATKPQTWEGGANCSQKVWQWGEEPCMPSHGAANLKKTLLERTERLEPPSSS